MECRIWFSNFSTFQLSNCPTPAGGAVRIAVDAMGGDHAPDVVVAGAVTAGHSPRGGGVRGGPPPPAGKGMGRDPAGAPRRLRPGARPGPAKSEGAPPAGRGEDT